MDQQDPEKHSAERRYQPASPAQDRQNSSFARRRNRHAMFTVATVVAVALILFFGGAKDFHGYFAGTPTTATVTDCTEGNFQRGAWRIGGVSQSGPLLGGFLDDCDVGQSVDVRVTNGNGYTAGSWPFAFVAGGGLLLGAVFYLWWRRRTGR
jgi:hypothetical protein